MSLREDIAMTNRVKRKPTKPAPPSRYVPRLPPRKAYIPTVDFDDSRSNVARPTKRRRVFERENPEGSSQADPISFRVPIGASPLDDPSVLERLRQKVAGQLLSMQQNLHRVFSE